MSTAEIQNEILKVMMSDPIYMSLYKWAFGLGVVQGANAVLTGLGSYHQGATTTHVPSLQAQADEARQELISNILKQRGSVQ